MNPVIISLKTKNKKVFHIPIVNRILLTMGIFIERKRYIISAVIAIAACVMMIAFADTAVLSAKKGISLWLSSVLPAMLPFFICVNFMIAIGLAEILPVKIFPFVMSAMSGYPMGAKVVGDMYRNNLIDVNEAKRLMSFCSTSGPVFMVGAVGVGIMESQAAGFIIAMSHYAGAIVNGLIYSVFFKGKNTDQKIKNKLNDYNLQAEITNAIFAAFKSMSVILAYIIFFMFVMDIISITGIFDFIESDFLFALINGFIEMTVGCSSISGAGLTLAESCICASIIISWGGISIIGQMMSMLTDTGISVKYIAITKLTHSIFAGIISLFLVMLVL